MDRTVVHNVTQFQNCLVGVQKIHPQTKMEDSTGMENLQAADSNTETVEAENDSWCEIESDPGVFTQLIRDFGCVGAQVEEIWSLEANIFHNLEPIHGLIFLFKWMHDEQPDGRVVSNFDENIYFAKQVVENSCATHSILSLLLNLKHPDIELGEMLTRFRDLTINLDPLSRGYCLGNDRKIRTAHNSLARPTFIVNESQEDEIEAATYHFVSYMPIGERLYELNGLRLGPTELAVIAPGQNWLDIVRPIIEARMHSYSTDEIHFNLMALVSDRQRFYERQIEQLQRDSLQLPQPQREAELNELLNRLRVEKEKNRQYSVENARRHHNYVPFIVELLKQMGELGELTPILEEAKLNESSEKVEVEDEFYLSQNFGMKHTK
ncbi:ubiquitin carboxyl-terminal hydrolase isozyme L5-like isoform X1 [Drosophila guanche]|uniref:Ubiquitin carboxyl-terminal hydrolase n=3 Tax=Drosophila guanche TaxID=7266 RepID=A0A3B0KDZ6_DROGU|nr:ubiquitin carboxyl-terminal hydrolase isozyme L5-like isoform X1 [Drosophila guanche]SPP86520.1 blast:Ubiquitin carboxyl-terminal hydrolase isozyme L5 [Drosophila guanche]